jgi:hypothetical protein
VKYRCWTEGRPGAVREIEAEKTRSAALSLAHELWESEEWEGDEALRVVVQNPAGAVVVYPIRVELELRLVLGPVDVRLNSNGGPPR